MSIAQLGYEIDSSQAVKAAGDLDKMGAAADKAGGQAEGLEKKSTGLSRTLKSLAPVAAGLAGSLAAMFSVRSVINAAEQYETRMARVNAVIRATGGVAGRTAEQLEQHAQALARATLESVDGVMQAQQILLTFRNVQGDVFDRAIESAADMAAAMGGDVVSSTRQLARALEDPINGVTALTRSGTVFTAQQRDMIRAMVESGRTAEAQGFILSELEAQYGGVARAAGGLTAAKDSLGQSFTNLLISINEQLGLTDGLARIYNSLAGSVQSLADNLGDVLARSYDTVTNALKVLISLTVAYASTHIPALIAAMSAKVGALTLANAQLLIMQGRIVASFIAMRTMSTVTYALGGAMAFLGGPLGLVLGILGGLTAAAILFRDTTETMSPIVDDAKDAIDRINGVLATSSEAMLPAAQRETLNLTNRNIEMAKSAYEAADAELAKAKAALYAADMQIGAESMFSGTGMPITSQAETERAAAMARLTEASAALRAEQESLTQRISEGQLALTQSSEAMAENQRKAIELSVSMDDLANSLGTGGGGSGGSGEDEESTGLLARFQALRDELRTQAEQVEIWYVEAQDALQWALENERLTLEEHAQMKLQIEQLYQEQLAAIRAQANNQGLENASRFFGSLATIAQAGGDRMTQVARGFSAAQALINTWLAASQTLADPRLGFFAKFAAVAKVVAAGMGLVNAIRGGGSSASGGGGAGSVSTSSAPASASGVTQAQTPLRRTIVELRGPDWVKGIVQPVMEQIYQASEDGQVVFAR
jgi:hypothetical protein